MSASRAEAGPSGRQSEALIRHVLETLIVERQRLRREDADRATLDANRLAIAYWQRQLARVVADRHRSY